MGLDCSHDAFHGAYSAFNRFRQAVCKALGPNASFPPHWQYDEKGDMRKDENGLVMYDRSLDERNIYFPEGFSEEANPGLWEFLTHSDCDGEISPEMCVKVADEMEKLLPAIEGLGWDSHGHIAARGGLVEVTKKFIAGCRAAAEAGEPLDFH